MNGRPKHPLSSARTRPAKTRASIIDLAPFTAPHVDGEVAGFGGTVRLYSASGGLEAVWIKVVDLDGAEGSFHPPAARVVGAPVRLTPHNARCLAAALNAYADTHAETEVEL